MKTRANLLICIAAGLLLVACGPEPTPTPGPSVPAAAGGRSSSGLPGTNWTLASLAGQSPVNGTAVTLNFGTDGKVSGSDGCNNYTSTYTSDASTVKIQGPMASTQKACAAPIMAQATAYTTALGQAATYTMAREKLTLSDSSGKELMGLNAQSSDLAGTDWTVISYNNGKQAVVSVMNGTTLTVNFAKDGSVAGSGGCNDYSATYTTDGKSTIKFGPITSTQKACGSPEGVMEQESAYFAALSTAATYSIDGTHLEMRTADGAIAASFQKAAPAGSFAR